MSAAASLMAAFDGNALGPPLSASTDMSLT